MKLKELIKEEVQAMLEASMTKNFRKAIESLQDVQLKQQQLQKAFVAEKNVKKKEKLKQALIKMHKIVQKAESEFNQALRSEPVELEESRDAYTLHRLANNVGQSAANDFLEDNNVDIKSLAKAIQQKTIDKYTLRDIVKGTADKSTIKKFKKDFVSEQDVNELDVRKVHGDKRIENPKTGNKVKLRTALKAKKGSQVYRTARRMYNNLKGE